MARALRYLREKISAKKTYFFFAASTGKRLEAAIYSRWEERFSARV